MKDDELDGALGGPVPVREPNLTQRALAAGFPTLAAYVDHLEAITARYEGREDDAMDPRFLPDGRFLPYSTRPRR